jgi:hypothetical protein
MAETASVDMELASIEAVVTGPSRKLGAKRARATSEGSMPAHRRE